MGRDVELQDRILEFGPGPILRNRLVGDLLTDLDRGLVLIGGDDARAGDDLATPLLLHRREFELEQVGSDLTDEEVDGARGCGCG